MDPLTHTLFGGVLAETGLKHRGALALPTLLIGVNLPDIDAVTYIHGPDAGLLLRRGWTHGVLAMVLLPVALTLFMVTLDGWRRKRGHDGPPVRPGELLLLSYLAVLSHPFLDWLNTYGVRVLMPFSDRWFYGDALFIVDPWIWLLLGAVIFSSHSATARELSRWAALALVATVFLFLSAGSHRWAPWLWTAILSILITVRWRLGPPTAAASQRLAVLALLATTLYVSGMIGLTAWARGEVWTELERVGIEPTAELMAGPDRFNPFLRLVVVPTEAGYRVGRVHFLDSVRVRLEDRVISAVSPTILPPVSQTVVPKTVSPKTVELINAARATPCVRSMVQWMRFPFYEIETSETSYDVYMLDARYVRRRTRGFGGTTVRIESDLTTGQCRGGVSLP